MGVSVGVGSGALVAGRIVSVGGGSGLKVSVGVAEQAVNKNAKQSARKIRTRVGLFFIPLIILTFRTCHGFGSLTTNYRVTLIIAELY
jgi:alcohol dehydrogenase class IV